MEITTILQLAGSYGFPIVMCLMMWTYMKDTLSKFQQAINNNTNVLTELVNKLKRRDDNGD